MLRRSTVLLLLLAAPALAAQPHPDMADPAASAEATVVELFDAMRAADSSAVADLFLPKATLHSVTRSGDDAYRLTEGDIDQFVAGIGGEHPVYDERISGVQVHVDDGLASAWMAYRFYIGEQFSHCGVNTFTMVMTDDGWKILAIVDTRRQGCE